VDKNGQALPLLTIRLCYFWLYFFAAIAAITILAPQATFALDPLLRSPRVGSLRIPLHSYNRVPISKLLSDPTSYHLREIRIAGTVRIVETRFMTRGCGKPYELTVISLDDESGEMDVIDHGACGRNTSPVRAPMLTVGDRVNLLVHVTGEVKTNEPGAPPEVIVLWIDRAQE